MLIDEVASVLGITPDDVRSRFTKEQLDDLLNSSLCEPVSESGPPFDTLEVPCEDPVPELLPPVDLSSLDELEAAAQEQETKILEKTKCIDKVEEVNAIIDEQLKQYLDHKILHDKLVEYEDNFSIVGLYFQARSDEVSRVLDLFQPLLLERETIGSSLSSLVSQRTELTIQLGEASFGQNIGNVSLTADQILGITNQIRDINSQIDQLQGRRSEIDEILKQRTDDFDVFDETYYDEVVSSSGENNPNFGYYLSQLFNRFIGINDILTFSTQVQDYSTCVTITRNTQGISSIQDLVERSFFDFKIRFPKLNFLSIPKEEYDRTTGNRVATNSQFLIKQNPLLEKTSFFNNTSIFEISEFVIDSINRPSGTLYRQFYDLLEDPLNNFFTPDERGLTTSIDLIDPRVRNTAAQIKKEKNASLYVKDLDVMQSFYSTAESQLESKFVERRSQVITSSKEALKITVSKIARKEVRVILALNKVNQYLVKDSVELSSTITMLNQQNEEIVGAYSDLNSEILRIREKINELKPTPTKIKSTLKSYSPECFDSVDQEVTECPDTKQKLGIDPLFLNTLSGTDPTLPTFNQLCYWKEFSKIANLQGLFPLPNLPEVTKLRYWPVGLIIPTPSTLIKIPLPITWIPLVTISSPLGVIVIFLTINGVFISPVVFFISSTGFKQHIITVRGPSEKFGYSSEDESVKPSIYSPLTVLSSASRQARLSAEESLGKNFDLSPQQREDLTRQNTILTRVEQAAVEDGNENRQAKASRERRNLDEAASGLTLTEKFEKLLNKRDEAADSIKKAKKAIFNRLDELGSPQIKSINSLKERIVSRREALLVSLKNALEIGDLDAVKRIREELKVDGISLSEKISAINKDVRDHYQKLKFPKIVIPNDYSSIDPKKNAIFEFADFIRQFSEINGTQFFTPREASVRNLFLIQLAKSKDTVLQDSSDFVGTDGKIDLDTDLEKAKTVLSQLNKKLTDRLSGQDQSISDVDDAELANLKTSADSESDPVKKKQKTVEFEKKSKAKQDFLAQETQRLSLALTPQVLASLNQLSVDFNPFAPCCQKETFSLPLGESPALPIIASASGLLDSFVAGLDSRSLKSLVGGRSRVTLDELASAHVNIIKKSIPTSLSVPLPGLDVLTVASSFSGIFLSLFEPKAPIEPAQPALPTSITIDLNRLKTPLLSLLLGFLKNSLPDPNSQPTQILGASPAKPSRSLLDSSKPISASQDKAIIDPNLEIITCDPTTSEDSILSGGSLHGRGASQAELGTDGLGSVISRSNKDILPSFQTLDSDFLSVNPGDLLAVMRNFVDLQFSKVENLVAPFYSLLNTVRGVDGMNLNVIEAAQQLAPPYGPPVKAAFFATTALKKSLPRATNFKVIDPDAAKQKIGLIESSLAPITSSPVIGLVVAGAGAADAALPKIKVPKIDPQTGEVKTEEKKVTTLGLRNLHPILSQDDVPSWERLSSSNPLFLLFLDEFVATGADQVGFFRAYA